MKRTVFIVICLFITLSSFGQKNKTTKKITKSYTVEQALEYVEDYFSFYEADTAYENPEARKISNNVFHIRVDVCTCIGGSGCYEKKRIDNSFFETTEKNSFCWHSKLYILTIGSGGKYSMREKFNY